MDIDQNTKLLQQIAQGDHKAFEHFFLLYHPKIINFMLGFIKEEEDVYDLGQEFFCKLWINRKKLIHVSSLNAYLFRIAKNMIHDYYACSLSSETYTNSESTGFLMDDHLIEEEIFAKELLLLIDITIEQMPPQRRQIFCMSRKEGFSNTEIAEKLGIHKRTVENQLSLALTDIRKALKTILIFLFEINVFRPCVNLFF